MFTLPVAESSGAGGEPWLTTDRGVNSWLRENIDPNCLAALANLTEPDRRSKAFATMSKHTAGKITGNPSAYIMGILRREGMGPYGGGSPWQAAAGTASTTRVWPNPTPMMHGPPLDAGSLRTVASPLASHRPAVVPEPPSAAVPDWIHTAWGLRKQPGPLLRLLSQHLPNVMPRIVKLPSDVQMAAIIIMLMAPEAHLNPEKFLVSCVEAWARMPASTDRPGGAFGSPIPGVAKVAVVHLGETTGWELHAVNLAVQMVVEGGSNVQLIDLVCATMPTPWAAALEEFVLSMSSSHSASCLLLSEAKQKLQPRVAQWAAAGAKIVVLITIPFATSPTSGSGAFPGPKPLVVQEIAPMLEIAHMLLAGGAPIGLVTMQASTPQRTGDEEALNRIFGDVIPIEAAKLRLPHACWSLRASPITSVDGVVGRQLTLPGSSYIEFDDGLRGALDASAPVPAQLPPLAIVESIGDKIYAKDTLTNDEQAKLALVRLRDQPGGNAGSLLSRDSLALLFGVKGFHLMAHLKVKMPCSKFVSPFSGLEQPESDGGEPCGKTRYCPGCAYFFNLMVERPSMWQWVAGITPVLKCIVAESPEGTALARPPVPLATVAGSLHGM